MAQFMKKICIAACLFLMVSCSVSRNETVDNDMEVKRLIRYEDALKGDMKYSTLFDSLSIVPLDTTGGYMIGEVKQMKISAHYIAVLDRNSNVFVYNHEGEGAALISRKGQGEKEYIDVRGIDILTDSLICLLTYPPKLMYFKMDGTFHSEVPLKNRAFELAVLPDGKAVLYKNNIDDGTMNMSLLEIYNPSDDSYKGYVPGIRFMENQPIPHFQQFGTLTMTQRNGLLFTHSLTNNIYGIDNKGVHIKYRIDFGDRNPSFHYPKKLPEEKSVTDYLIENFPVCGFNSCWENSSYLHWGGYLSGKPVTFLYDKEADRLYSDFNMQEDFTGLTPSPIMASDDCLAVYFTTGNVEALMDYLEYSGKQVENQPLLDRMATFVREAGNPIVGFYHFKRNLQFSKDDKI